MKGRIHRTTGMDLVFLNATGLSEVAQRERLAELERLQGKPDRVVNRRTRRAEKRKAARSAKRAAA